MILLCWLALLVLTIYISVYPYYWEKVNCHQWRYIGWLHICVMFIYQINCQLFKIVHMLCLLTCICLTAGVNLLTPSGHLQIRDVITTGIDMCGRRMRKGWGYTIYPSRRWLSSFAWTAVSYVCLSTTLKSCTTSKAETNLDAIKKQKNAEYSKRYRLKRKMKMQQQAPTTSEAEPQRLQV